MDYFISDLHFGHKNIIKYEKRPFENVEDMDLKMVENWNKQVKDKDRVYIIGDLCFYTSSEKIKHLLNSLNGRKILIKGNHDKILCRDMFSFYFENIYDYYEYKINNVKYILFHYPIESWNGIYKGTNHLFGHVHSNLFSNYSMPKPKENSYNVCAEVLGYVPRTIEEIIFYNKLWHENKNWSGKEII